MAHDEANYFSLIHPDYVGFKVVAPRIFVLMYGTHTANALTAQSYYFYLIFHDCDVENSRWKGGGRCKISVVALVVL